MAHMFHGAASFNQDLDQWDTSKVGNMRAIFSYAGSFNGNISSWHVTNVRIFSEAFTWAASFDQPLTNWEIGEECLEFSGVFGRTPALSDCNKRRIHDMLAAHLFPSGSSCWDTYQKSGAHQTWPNLVCPATFATRAELVQAVDVYLGSAQDAYDTYGNISFWDVSRVTDMQACRFERLRQHAAHMHTPRPNPAPARTPDVTETP
jgi:surface protein